MTKDESATSGFSAEERAAMKQRAAELKAESKVGSRKDKAAEAEAELLDKIATMPEPDRSMAERVHGIVTKVAPDLAPKLYYGQPGYARDGKVVCFFRSGQADKEPHSTFGFSALADLGEASGFWPTAYALSEPTEKAWKELEGLVERATD